jgi:hypothetical protein
MVASRTIFRPSPENFLGPVPARPGSQRLAFHTFLPEVEPGLERVDQDTVVREVIAPPTDIWAKDAPRPQTAELARP